MKRKQSKVLFPHVLSSLSRRVDHAQQQAVSPYSLTLHSLKNRTRSHDYTFFADNTLYVHCGPPECNEPHSALPWIRFVWFVTEQSNTRPR